MNISDIRNLENKKLLITEAITRSNTVSKRSKINNQFLDLKTIIYERSDCVFFENVEYNDIIYRPAIYINNEDQKIDLHPAFDMRKKSICIVNYVHQS